MPMRLRAKVHMMHGQTVTKRMQLEIYSFVSLPYMLRKQFIQQCLDAFLHWLVRLWLAAYCWQRPSLQRMNTHPTGTSSHLTAFLACSKASLIQCSISASVSSPSCCMQVVIFIKESQKSMSFWVNLGSAAVLVGSGVCNISERVDMQLESNSESKSGMDSVAQALMNIFSNDAENSEDHSLSMFLVKVYKNNLSPKPKRMNSIRLTRFNAFLYRLHSNYPTSPNANTLLHHALLAVLTNDRNFQEEEDEEIVLSIGRWACHLAIDTITRGFYDSAYAFLKYLVDGDRPTLLPLSAFEEMLRNEPYFSEMELSSEDERVALRGQSNFSITGALSLHEFILSQLDLHQIYLNLYQNAAEKREIVRLFNRHMAKSSPHNPADLFQQVFLSRPLSSASSIESVFQALEESYFSQQATVRILELVIRQQQKVSIFMELALRDNAIDSMFLQLLSKHWRIEQLVDEFLAAKSIKNTAILFLIVNSENPIPKQYMLMPFNERDLKYQHAIVFTLALTQHKSKTMPGQLIQLLARAEDRLPKERKALIFRAIHYSLAAFEKKALYSNIINLPLLANFNGAPTLDFLPMGECKSDRANAQDKKRLLKMLESYSQGGDNAMKIKAQLLGVCNVVSATTKRIKQLNQLMQRPFEDILRQVTEEAIKRDPELVAALLMAANNKLFLTFFPEPRTEIVEVLISLYLEYHNSFSKSIGRLENQDRNSHKSQYYAAVFRLGLHLKRKFGSLGGDLGALLNGETNYKRVNGVDFAEYFIGEEEKRGLLGQLWVGKKIAFQLRKLLENVVNFNASNSENRRQLKGLFENDWESPLAFEAIRTYIQAGIQDPQVLVELLALLQPSYAFLEKVERTFNQQLDDYTDILYYTPELLREVYPEMLAFLAQLVDSQPVKREKDKDRERRKSSKKKKGDREKQERRAIASDVYNNADHILDNNALFECLMKRRELRTLFGDADLLPNFSPLTAILLKINDQFNRLQRIANEWLPSLRIFHCQKPQGFQQWSLKVMSYCQLWQVFLVKKGFKFPPVELERHFHILTEFLNGLYESKRQLPQFEQKILITLLLIYQASRGGTVQQAQVPAQALKNFFLGYRLPTPNEQHYYICFTCNLPICQVCLPFLHKHHDINYLGKDGYCVHDNNKRGKEEDKQQQQQLLQQQLSREQRLRQLQRYSVGPPPGNNIFQAPAYHPALMRNQRREEDWLMSSFEFPDEEMDFGEHLRFKEIMEMRMKDQRERERDREREKDSLFSRERERMERDREDILLMFEKDKNQNNPNGNGIKEDLAQIRSSSCKSIRNLHYSHPNRQYFVPEFTPTPEPQGNYPLTIDTRPLRCLLLRELRAQGAQESQRTVQGKTTVSLLNERYNFFNKSNYFKSGGRPDFGMMRGMALAGMSLARRSLLTSNNRFLAYPTPNNGVILMVLANILAKMTKRIQTRSMADFQQERGFLAASINNSNFSFEPLQIQFNRHSPNLLAIIGLNQLGFALLTNQGKLQKYSDSDFKSNEPITKFVWLSKHRNIFAVANGNSIRLGHVNDEGRVKTTNRFRVHIEKTIRDFQINSESGVLFVYILDNQGGLYRAEFDYRGSKTLNITDKRLNYPENLEQLQSLIFADKKLLLTSGTGKCYLLQVQGKAAPPTYLQTFDFETALRAHENTKFIKWPVFASQLQVLQSSEHLFSVGCLLKRAAGDPKKRGGYLFIMRGGSKQNLEMILLHEEETIESYEVTEMSENSFLITAIDENGSVFCFNYHIPPELFSLREDTKIPIDDNSIQLCNTLVRTNNLLALARYCEPKRYENFKESKDLTGAYKVVIDSATSIKAGTNDPFKFFWTGVLFTAEPKGQQSELVFDIFGRHYSFQINKPREIQIPLNIKQTMEIFTADGDFAILFQKSGVDVKNFRIHGIEYSAESIYKRAFIHLHKLVITYLAFSANSLQQYLENVDRHSLASLELTKFADLKTNQKYSSKELILLMKLELLRESIEESLTEEGSLDEVLQSVRTHLLPQCEKRHYLEKSCWKLIRRLCQLALPLSQGVTGHPLEYRTVLDFYYFEACYSQWASSHHLSHFEQLVNLLYALIFKRIGNLYIIFKVYPDLIYELTSFYKTLLQSLKFSRNEARDQAQLQKLVNICPNFVALVCEYYQTLRNSAGRAMVDEKEEESPQSIILSLLQEVFCATRKQLYREVFISPEVYLQKLYLSTREPQPIDTVIDIFRISSHPSPHSHPLPNVHPPVSQEPEEIKSEEEEMEMDEESEKEAMLQEEARDMIQGIEEGDSSNQMQVEKQGEQKCRRIHTSLNNNLLPPGTRLTFTYYQFSFQMATALFTLDNHITPQNAVFYIGFLFNLLRILEMNLDPVRDAAYLKDFFRAVHSRVYSQKHSVLYMVLNYFFEPNYGDGLFKREIKPSQSKLCTEFVKYLQEESVSATSLLLNFEVGKTSSTVSLGQAMKFVAFQIENHLYQLKFLGNLHFNAKLITGTQPTHIEAFKYYILAGVVRHGLRVLKNVMYFQGWQGELEDARVEVGFQNLTVNPAEGLKILVGCSKNNPEIFIKKLNEDSRKIEILETLLETQKSESTQIIEMLTTYYSS